MLDSNLKCRLLSIVGGFGELNQRVGLYLTLLDLPHKVAENARNILIILIFVRNSSRPAALWLLSHGVLMTHLSAST